MASAAGFVLGLLPASALAGCPRFCLSFGSSAGGGALSCKITKTHKVADSQQMNSASDDDSRQAPFPVPSPPPRTFHKVYRVTPSDPGRRRTTFSLPPADSARPVYRQGGIAESGWERQGLGF